MKKLFYCAAFVAAMGLFTTANAQNTAQKKEVKKDTDDASNTWEIRDEETGKITGYKFMIRAS